MSIQEFLDNPNQRSTRARLTSGGTPWRKQQPVAVRVGSKHYDSINSAARGEGVHKNTVIARCNSQTGRFDTWTWEKAR